MARTVKCPGCGADLTVKDDNRDFMFCECCGTKVRLDDYQETHRFVDEARMRKNLSLRRWSRRDGEPKTLTKLLLLISSGLESSL